MPFKRETTGLLILGAFLDFGIGNVIEHEQAMGTADARMQAVQAAEERCGPR